MNARAETRRGGFRGPALGVVVPFDMELDRELWRWLPEDVDLLITRTPYVDDAVTIEFARELTHGSAIPVAVRSVVAGRARVVAYACTSASFVSGRGGEAVLRETITGAGAQEAITTSGAIIEALAALGARRVAVATPYLPELSALLDRFLAEWGIEVTVHMALGLDRAIWEVSSARIAALVREVDRPEADAIVLSCTNLPSYELIAPLEEELGKPIVTANQATMWAALGRMGRAPVGEGQALASREWVPLGR